MNHDREHIEESKEILNRAIDRSSLCMVLVNTSGIICYANASAREVLKQDSLTGLEMRKVFPGWMELIKTRPQRVMVNDNHLVFSANHLPVLGRDLVVMDQPSGSVLFVFSAMEPLLSLDQMEKMLIERTFAGLKSNITKIARSLGISRNTLYGKMKKYKINR